MQNDSNNNESTIGDKDPEFEFKKTVNKQIRQVFALQEKRVVLSNVFDIKFREYLLDAPKFDFAKFKVICKETTDEMNILSKSILDVKASISDNAHGFRALVERLQENEQIKFQHTVELYVTEQERLEKLEHTDEHESVDLSRIADIKKKLTDSKCAINECLEEMKYELFLEIE